MFAGFYLSTEISICIAAIENHIDHYFVEHIIYKYILYGRPAKEYTATFICNICNDSLLVSYNLETA